MRWERETDFQRVGADGHESLKRIFLTERVEGEVISCWKMAPGMFSGMPNEQNLEKQIEKQMGCMAGFLKIFDRQEILSGKKIYAKGLPVSPAIDCQQKVEKSVGSKAGSGEVKSHLSSDGSKSSVHEAPREVKKSPISVSQVVSPADTPVKMPLPFPVFEVKTGSRISWKLKEAPRLSLDSRAIVDAKGSLHPREIRTNSETFTNQCEMSEYEKQKRSPSVVARLMGLGPFPESDPGDNLQKIELRRSASESRANKDLLQHRFLDANFGSIPESKASGDFLKVENTPDLAPISNIKTKSDMPKPHSKTSSHWNFQQSPKTFYYSQEFFPETKPTGSLYGEIEKRLKTRGIDEATNDLETLKQILEALQLKGLLHSKKTEYFRSRRNIIIDSKFHFNESPIIVIKPSSKSPLSVNRLGKNRSDYSPSNPRSRTNICRSLQLDNVQLSNQRRNQTEAVDRSPQRMRQTKGQCHKESNAKSPSSFAKRSSNHELQKKLNDSDRRISPVHSPKTSPRKSLPDLITSRSPRNQRQSKELLSTERISYRVDDATSSVSESSISTSSQIDSERSKMEDSRDGRILLERCDKLLNSIAEFAAMEQPSPVSVLDSSLYKDDCSFSSPIARRFIDFKDQLTETEEDNWSPAVSPVRLKTDERSNDSDLTYISQVLTASNSSAEKTHIFSILEKRHYPNASKTSKLHRKLIFDIVNELIQSKTYISPWKAFILHGKHYPTYKNSFKILREVRRIQNKIPAEDLNELICGIIQMDMSNTETDQWSDPSMEMSDAVLDTERLIFKDLIGETIKELVLLAGKRRASPEILPRRKLVF